MNIKINLLPWRQIQQKKEKQKFIGLALTLLTIISFTCFFMDYCEFFFIKKQINSNKILCDEIEILNKIMMQINKIKIERNILVKHLSFMLEIENKRILALHLFTELSKIIPEGIRLNSLNGTDEKITLEGRSEANESLALLLKNIKNNQWMQAENLVEIKKIKSFKSEDNFKINFTLNNKIGSKK
ncbi:MAG: PilN domain-containing protein [Tatlockia sp.]|nr:PilN domain-containing protein [Tatlockia sp.]